MPVRMCRTAACPNVATSRGLCADCGKARHRRRNAARHADAQERRGFYKTRRWQMTRRRQLTAHPLCQHVVGGSPCDRVAEIVHHVVDIADGGALYDPANLASLCKRHHDQITWARQQARINASG
jgi:5-methylcytosine-specific restriction protein A